MIKYATILLVLLICLNTNNILKAQSYSIESLEGTKTKIKLSNEQFSGKLTISCLKDKIFISDYMSIDTVRLIRNKFLQIVYNNRAGNNQSLKNLLLLCVSNGKLYQTMHLQSFSKSDLLDEHSLYWLEFNLIGTNKINYKINVNVHDENKSKRTSKTNHDIDNQFTLRFDTISNAFYNVHEKLVKSVTVYDPKIQNEIKQYINGDFPKIRIDKTDYYCIKGEWYEKGNGGVFLKYSYK